MATATVIFVCAALYAFTDYYKTSELKDLGFAIILSIGAIATFIQTINNDEQSNNIEKLAKLDTAISRNIENLAVIDTSISSNTNGIAGNILGISKQNVLLSDSIRKLDSIVYSITKEIKKISVSTKLLASKLDIKTDEEFAVSGEFNLLLSKKINDLKIIYGSNTLKDKKTSFADRVNLNGIIGMVGYSPIILQTLNDTLLITTRLYDEQNNLVVEIEKNKWRINKNLVGKFNFDSKGVEVFDNKGRCFLSLDILPDNTIVIRAILTSKGSIIILTENGTHGSVVGDGVDLIKQMNIKPLFEYSGIKWHGVRRK